LDANQHSGVSGNIAFETPPPTPLEFKYNREFLKQLELTPVEEIDG
jgi:hypothetical protein